MAFDVVSEERRCLELQPTNPITQPYGGATIERHFNLPRSASPLASSGTLDHIYYVSANSAGGLAKYNTFVPAHIPHIMHIDGHYSKHMRETI